MKLAEKMKYFKPDTLAARERYVNARLKVDAKLLRELHVAERQYRWHEARDLAGVDRYHPA